MAGNKIIAIVRADLSRGSLGFASLLGGEVAGRTVLGWTVSRLARVAGIEGIVLVHRAGQEPKALLKGYEGQAKVSCFVPGGEWDEPQQAMRVAGRKWATTAWRGGLGGASCYDELLPAGHLAAALEAHEAEVGLLVGGDWLLVDPGLCGKLVEMQRQNAEAMQMVFCQAPPGLAGIVADKKLLGQMAGAGATFGQLLTYNPAKPQADPIGRDVCLQISAEVRGAGGRFIFDTPRTAAMIGDLAGRLGERFEGADAELVARTYREAAAERPGGWGTLPQQVTVEITPRRIPKGIVVPQGRVRIERGEMGAGLALEIVKQLGAEPDTALLIGGLGDALLHRDWEEIVQGAHEAGVWGIGLETDLLVDEAVIEKLLSLPIDLVTIRLNADTAAVYAKVMGSEEFSKVAKNLELLFNQRNRVRGRGTGKFGLPWVVPRMVKTKETLADMETFFDRWMHYLGHAVIEPATSGCGLVESLSPVEMSPPGRVACRQLNRRMTIHSDGRVALCDQDWLGRAVAGDVRRTSLAEIWKSMGVVREAHRDGKWDDLELCRMCKEWHRP